MLNKYSYEGFVEVEVGAFVGAFTIGAAQNAATVLAYEPASKTGECLKKNTQEKENIEHIRKVAWNENASVRLNLSRDPTDHSILDLDRGTPESVVEVEGERLDRLRETHDIGTIDFLKIDAEGAEPEVIEGATNINVRKIAVDCGAERYGEPTFESVKPLLRERGYDVIVENQTLYARSES